MERCISLKDKLFISLVQTDLAPVHPCENILNILEKKEEKDSMTQKFSFFK